MGRSNRRTGRGVGLGAELVGFGRPLHCPERWQFAHSGPAGELSGGDPKFFRDPRLRPISAPVPAESDPVRELPEPMRRKITELAGYLGY
jgi:hypothetical protein